MSPYALVALLVPWLAYVLPVERVVLLQAESRERWPALRIEAELEGLGSAWPPEVRFELHPELGFRLAVGTQRWLFPPGGGVVGGAPPPYVPDLRLLSLSEPEALLAQLLQLGIDVDRNALARCGDADCFVLGGRSGGVQLWVEKEQFDILELRVSGRSQLVLEDYRDWGGGWRLPARIRLRDGFADIAVLRILSVSRVPGLADDDFSPRWVQSAPALPAPARPGGG